MLAALLQELQVTKAMQLEADHTCMSMLCSPGDEVKQWRSGLVRCLSLDVEVKEKVESAVWHYWMSNYGSQCQKFRHTHFTFLERNRLQKYGRR